MSIVETTQSSKDDFRELVRQMRRLQKEYYRTKNLAVLEQCKLKERKVDKELLRDGQGDLF